MVRGDSMGFFEAIAEYFEICVGVWRGIFDSIVSGTKLIISLFRELPLLINLTTAFTTDVPKYLNWLPPAALSIIVVTIVIIVVYKFFGRT